MHMSENPNHISILNFDAVEQLRLWQQVGPRKSLEMLIGAMRTALLLGQSVHLDRNQLFEGTFFLAMSPDRLAWHLGLEPSAKLPLTIRMLPCGSEAIEKADFEVGTGPWAGLVQDGLGWGVSDDLAREIESNLIAVADDKRRVSSLMQAMAVSNLEGAQSVVLSGLERAKAFEQLEDSFLPRAVWSRRDTQLSEGVIAHSRGLWLEALKLGRVEIIAWDEAANSTPNVSNQLERHFPELPNLPLHNSVAEALLNVTRKSGDKGTVRSLIVRWLDAEKVEELVPATFPIGASASEEADLQEAKELALKWWIKCYYRAIAARDKLDLYEIYSHPDGPQANHRASLEVEWGLIPGESNSKSQGMETKEDNAGTFAVGGNVAEKMLTCTPGQFARLRDYTLGRSYVQTDPKEQRQRLRDLALAVEDGTAQLGERKNRIRLSLLKASVLLAIGAVLGISELVNPFETGGWFFWTFLLALVSSVLPWGEFRTLYKLSETGMKSTIEVA